MFANLKLCKFKLIAETVKKYDKIFWFTVIGFDRTDKQWTELTNMYRVKSSIRQYFLNKALLY